jgi:7-carboxy-7-deazaguanine synthase
MMVNEIFLSIQGEGKEIGRPTVFIRLTGCNLRCNWCDTEYAFYEGKKMSVEEVLDEVDRYGIKRVCITGGEPLLQRDEVLVLVDALLSRGYEISIETNGSLPIDGIHENVLISMDWKTPSSGESEKMLESNLKFLREKDQLKFVIADERDYEYARDFLRKWRALLSCEVIFQPVGVINIRWLAEKVLEDRLDVRVLPQLHKVIWGNERGV